jgi:hypothetical protein
MSNPEARYLFNGHYRLSSSTRWLDQAHIGLEVGYKGSERVHGHRPPLAAEADDKHAALVTATLRWRDDVWRSAAGVCRNDYRLSSSTRWLDQAHIGSEVGYKGSERVHGHHPPLVAEADDKHAALVTATLRRRDDVWPAGVCRNELPMRPARERHTFQKYWHASQSAFYLCVGAA